MQNRILCVKLSTDYIRMKEKQIFSYNYFNTFLLSNSSTKSQLLGCNLINDYSINKHAIELDIHNNWERY